MLSELRVADDLDIPGERPKRFSVICEMTVGVSPSFDTAKEALEQYGDYKKTWGDKVKVTILDRRQEILREQIARRSSKRVIIDIAHVVSMWGVQWQFT